MVPKGVTSCTAVAATKADKSRRPVATKHNVDVLSGRCGRRYWQRVASGGKQSAADMPVAGGRAGGGRTDGRKRGCRKRFQNYASENISKECDLCRQGSARGQGTSIYHGDSLYPWCGRGAGRSKQLGRSFAGGRLQSSSEGHNGVSNLCLEGGNTPREVDDMFVEMIVSSVDMRVTRRETQI